VDLCITLLTLEARSLVLERWREIETVAMALHERQMLSADEVCAVLSER
jgi:hypothetical protein